MCDFPDPYHAELDEFYGSDRFLELRQRFWEQRSLHDSGIQPHWDVGEAAKRRNWELEDDELESLRRYEVRLEALKKCIYKPSAYCYPGIYKEADEDKFLRVIDRWQSCIPLPLPVLTSTPCGAIGKRDGYHRLVVACLIGVESIPCWILGQEAIEILRVNEQC